MAVPRFETIVHNSREYHGVLRLRHSLLRAPLGLGFSDEDIQLERDDHHLVVSLGEVIAGCLVLSPACEAEVQMRQVAVGPAFQKRGLGRGIVEYSERFAREKGFSRMVLHAREPVVPFYEKLGYVREGEPFEEVSLVHWKMLKEL